MESATLYVIIGYVALIIVNFVLLVRMLRYKSLSGLWYHRTAFFGRTLKNIKNDSRDHQEAKDMARHVLQTKEGENSMTELTW